MLFIYLFLFILSETLPYQTLHFLEVGGLLALGICSSHSRDTRKNTKASKRGLPTEAGHEGIGSA